jgi:hypothetical protein
MKKFLIALTILSLFVGGWSQERADSIPSKKLQAEATFSLNSNGIAYVPAFSLDKPAIIGSFSLVKNRFSYDPALYFSLDLRPWIIDNWFHYKIVNRPVFELKAGAVISAFFSELEVADEVIHQTQKYLAAEIVGKYKFSPLSSLSFTYLFDRGQDPGTLKGHFFNLQADRSGMPLGKRVLLSASLQVFYLEYTGNNDGLFTAGYVSASLRNVPLHLFFQAIQALDSNISPFPGFKWNLGLSYSL